ncbi:FAD-dependent oxidoreductase [Stakelama sediminis]|uniref:Sulfide:quinone oxidoreductase n=1 Tax=Stakelama sediminis TaxID=463200 RepID=A0A840Z1N8_9SPHN|nr:FAD-dependent oxidoreductase [Stakelama sediminis]MBB5719602.1 sulfide:quinone oxidoreductase [Stakelama sediminis]
MSELEDRPHILILGGNFAGLACAQNIRKQVGDKARITVIDQKSYLLFVPNIPADVFEGRDPAQNQRMDLVPVLDKDDIAFIHGEVTAIDVDRRRVTFTPAERDGAEPETKAYDYLVIALGARLAYDRIEGFAEYGHTVSDLYHGQKLAEYLKNDYAGGPIAIGSARFHQGDGAKGLEPYPGGSIPDAMAACEGPPVEVMLSMATWLKNHDKGGPDKITVFTPAELIAEDAGEDVVKQLLDIASGMGFNYWNKTQDIKRLTAEGIDFADGRHLPCELKIIFPDWVAHDFLKDLPISDSQGFIKTDLLMRNPDYPEIFACGDCAAVTMPKLGAIGHQESEIVGLQIGKIFGTVSAEKADKPLKPEVLCIGDMGDKKAFWIHSNSWFGGDQQLLKMGRAPYFLKMRYRDMFFASHGKMPGWGLDAAELIVEGI